MAALLPAVDQMANQFPDFPSVHIYSQILPMSMHIYIGIRVDVSTLNGPTIDGLP
jgi:hypothetical protein